MLMKYRILLIGNTVEMTGVDIYTETELSYIIKCFQSGLKVLTFFQKL